MEDQEQVDKLLSISERTPKLTRILYDEERGLRGYPSDNLHAIDDIVAQGLRRLEDEPDAVRSVNESIDAGSGDDLSIILYTSGTTGRAKGVMLSAGGSIAAATDTVAFDKLTDLDRVLAYLP